MDEKNKEVLADETIQELQKAQQQKQQAQVIRNQLNDLHRENQEMLLVISNLEKYGPERTCYRLVGGVLVEKTSKEILLELKSTVEKVVNAMKKLDERREALEQGANSILVKHNDILMELKKREMQASN